MHMGDVERVALGSRKSLYKDTRDIAWHAEVQEGSLPTEAWTSFRKEPIR